MKRCNICGRVLDEFDIQQYATIRTMLLYGSRHDGEVVDIWFCNRCFDDLIDQCTVSPVCGAVHSHPNNIMEEGSFS